MISTILVPLDSSPLAEQAIPYAQALLPTGGAVVLFEVMPMRDPMVSDMETAVRTTLETVKARLDGTTIHWRTQVAYGYPADEILHAVADNQIDLIVMTTHGRGTIGRAIFGSVADRVSRASLVPVLLVRPHPEGPASPTADIRRLVVPLDGSALAEDALPLVIELTQRLGVEVTLVRAVDPAATFAWMTDGGGLAGAPVSAEVYDQIVAGIEADAQDYLTSVTTRLAHDGVRATMMVLDGSPYFAITDFTEPGDLIVMTSHGRGGALRWLLGSVADKLVREAPVPVLLVPAPGRGSPTQAG